MSNEEVGLVTSLIGLITSIIGLITAVLSRSKGKAPHQSRRKRKR